MIKTLSGIRFFLFLIIFIRHFDYINQTHSILPNYHTLHFVFFAVSCFFILSGFCIALGYFEKFKKLSKETLIDFYKKRLIKLYPLYFLTGLIFCIFWFIPKDFDWLWKFLFLYVPMLSPWSKYNAHGGNPVGWFIGALFFCYLIIPFVSNLLSKLTDTKKGWIIYSFAFWLISVVLILLFSKENYSYFYHFPILRLFEFLCGFSLGCIFKNVNLILKINHTKQSILDIFIIATICSLIYFVGKFDSWHTTTVLDYLLYIPLSCLLLIYISNIKSGFLFKVLENKITIFLANISLEMYLIHYIFIQFSSIYITISTKLETFICFIVLLGLTIIVSLLCQKLQLKIEKLFH